MSADPAMLGYLAMLFGQLSLIAVGGGQSVLPEMQRQVVDAHGWMSAREFAALFALAQAAPGPNILVVTAVGWRVAALPGAVVATLGIVGPSSLLSFATSHAWHRFRGSPWRQHVQAGVTPIAVGLVLASAAVLTVATTTGWLSGLLTAATAAAVLGTRVHPLAMLGAGAVLGALLG